MVKKLKNYTIDEDSNCWIWGGPVDKHGYGRIHSLGKNYLVHRESWRLHNRKSYKRKFVLHTCGNKRCINPAHLYLSDKREYKNRRSREKTLPRRLSVEISNEMYDFLEFIAKKRNCSKSKYVRRMIMNRIRHEEILK